MLSAAQVVEWGTDEFKLTDRSRPEIVLVELMVNSRLNVLLLMLRVNRRTDNSGVRRHAKNGARSGQSKLVKRFTTSISEHHHHDYFLFLVC